MTELEAVNIVLCGLSEHPVSSVELRHPSVILALAKLDIAREELLGEGWWFNTVPVTINVDTDGKVAYPADALAFVPDKYECIVRDGYLYNTDTQSFVFTENVSGMVTYDLAWTDLTSAAQRVVAFAAAMSAYVEDTGEQQPPMSLTTSYQLALGQLQAQHTRQRRYNARTRRQWWRYESARRG